MSTPSKQEPDQKQNADRDDKGHKIERDGFTADEIGAQSAYDDETDAARRLRRGDESRGDADERDIAGAVGSDEVSEHIGADTESRQPKNVS
jgi:hypothetical protein